MKSRFPPGVWLPIALLSTILITGCNYAGLTSEAPDSVKNVRLVAESDTELRFAEIVRDAMLRNCPATEARTPEVMKEHWTPSLRRFHLRQFRALKQVCAGVSSVEVHGRKVSLVGDFSGTDMSAVKIAWCNLLATGVTHYARGHRLVDENGRILDTCSTLAYAG